jgi:hypothetical protein
MIIWVPPNEADIPSCQVAVFLYTATCITLNVAADWVVSWVWVIPDGDPASTPAILCSEGCHLDIYRCLIVKCRVVYDLVRVLHFNIIIAGAILVNKVLWNA